MEKSLYEKISEDMNNCRRTHNYIVKNSDNARDKQKKDAKSAILAGEVIEYPLLYVNYFKTLDNLVELKQSDISMDICMDTCESKVKMIRDSKVN